MTSILQKIADKAVTVTVVGEQLSLRRPDMDAKLELKQAFIGATMLEDKSLISGAVHRATVKMLSACVVSDTKLKPDQWSVILDQADTAPDDWPGLSDLVLEAMTMCGLNARSRPDDAEVVDHEAEVDENVGEVPTK